MEHTDLDFTFAALADPTRRAILARLASGEASVMELAKPFAMSQPAISKHLKVLEREWIERYREFWEQSFQRLDSLLDELQGKSTSSPEKSEHIVETPARHSTHKRKKNSKLRGDIQ